MPEDIYRLTRANVLEGFLARGRVYHTEQNSARYEAKARTNLINKIRQLLMKAHNATSPVQSNEKHK